MAKHCEITAMKTAIVICIIGIVLLSGSWSVATEWHETGPGGGGYLRDFAFDPFDANRVYLTSDMVGVFVSDDAGDNWRWSSYGAPNPKGGIAVNPVNSNIIYITGPDGIYESHNRAKQWQLVYSKGNGYKGVNNQDFGALENSIFGKVGQPIGINQNGTIYVCTIVGDIIISRDRGRSWSRVSAGRKGEVISVVPVDEKKVVAAIFEEGVFLSKDEGFTWKRVLSTESGRLIALAAHPVQKEVLYSLVGTPSVITYEPKYSIRSFPASLYRSDDSGETWKLIYIFNKLAFSKGRRIMDISKNGTIIILTAREPIRSIDGGRAWDNSTLVLQEEKDFIYATRGKWDSSKFSIYSDYRREGRWYMTGMSAALRSEDDGRTWHYKVNGLRQNLYWFVKVNPENPNIIIASDIDHGLIRSIDGGNTWQDIVIDNPYEECDELQFAPDDNTYKTLYAFFMSPTPYIAKSLDYGSTWTVIRYWNNKKSRSMTRFCLTKGEKLPVMYVGEPQKGIWRSTDDGKSWKLKNNGLPDPQDITYIQFLESDQRGHLYIGIKSDTRTEGGIFSSINGGDTWFTLNQGLESRAVRLGSFEIDPNNPDNLWVGSGRSVYRSRDCGNSWEKRIDGVYGSSILVEPGNSDIVYVASFNGGGILEQYTAGIYKSVDGGNYFFNISGELLKTIGTSYRVYDLEYGWKEPGIIWAAPYTGGLIHTE